MLREGTTTRSSKQIAEESDALGANLTVRAGFGTPEATISASGLSDNFDQWFALMTDILLHPNFPDGELQKYKQRQLVNLRQQRTPPGFLATERFNKAVYGNFPAAVVSPTPESVRPSPGKRLPNGTGALCPAECHSRHRRRRETDSVVPKLNKAWADWKRNRFHGRIPPNPVACGGKENLPDRPPRLGPNQPGARQHRHRSPQPRLLAFEVVMNRILGGGPAGRLFLNLREEKGYTYGAYSSVTAANMRGPGELPPKSARR